MLKGAWLTGHITTTAKPPAEFLEADEAAKAAGKAKLVPNPEYETWVAKNNQVRSYLFSSLSKEIFSQVSSATTAVELWAAI
jgi:hypothetical protein